uniref:ARAD1A16764p n=1 Tax=Blastobotrys adeninivorans TaxID=409370 RepID=A0A060SY06_BLAAD
MRLFTLKISLAAQYPKSLALEHFSTSFNSVADHGDCNTQGFRDTPYQYIYDRPETDARDASFDYGHCECGDMREISWVLDLVNLKCPRCHRSIHSVCYGFQSNNDVEDVECYSCRRVALMPHEVRTIMTVRKFYHYYWNVGKKRDISSFNPSKRHHRVALENLAINEDQYNLLVNWVISKGMVQDGVIRRNKTTRGIGNQLMTESVQWLRSYLGDLCEHRDDTDPIDTIDTIETTEIIQDTNLHDLQAH